MFLHPIARLRDTLVDPMPESGLSRSTFLKAGVSATGGLLLSISLPRLIGDAEAADADSFAPSAFIRNGRDGSVTLIIGQVEMGQGTYTALPMLNAEELEVELNQGVGRTRTSRQQAVWQSAYRFPGDRRLDLGACFLGAPAAGGRNRQNDAGDRDCEQLDCRANLTSGREG